MYIILLLIADRRRPSPREAPVLENRLSDGRVPAIDQLEERRSSVRLPGSLAARTMMYRRPMPCSNPVRKASSALTVLRRAITWQIGGHATLSSQSYFKGLPMERRAGAMPHLLHGESHCRTLDHLVAEPGDGRSQLGYRLARRIEYGGVRRLQETRRQARLRADDSHRLDPIRVLGSSSAWRIRITTSGKQGRLTLPSDISCG